MCGRHRVSRRTRRAPSSRRIRHQLSPAPHPFVHPTASYDASLTSHGQEITSPAPPAHYRPRRDIRPRVIFHAPLRIGR